MDVPEKYGGKNVVKHNLNWVEKKTKASFQFYWNPTPKDIELTVRITVKITDVKTSHNEKLMCTSPLACK